jgi:pyrroline-5-carboxylate reductase
VNNDLVAAALVQLASIMGGNWILVEALGTRLRIGKLWLSLVVGPLLTMAAYALGWFTALPTAATVAGLPLLGARAYLSAAFAGFIASLLTSAAHAAMVGSKGGGTE